MSTPPDSPPDTSSPSTSSSVEAGVGDRQADGVGGEVGGRAAVDLAGLGDAEPDDGGAGELFGRDLHGSAAGGSGVGDRHPRVAVRSGSHPGGARRRVTTARRGRATVMTVRLRSLGIGMTVAAGLMQSCQPACAPAPPAAVCTPPAGVPDSGPSGRGRDGHRLPGRRRPARPRRHVWQCAAMDMPGRVGSNGVRELATRRSGDGTTPGGIFGLGTMTAPNRDVVPVLRQRRASGELHGSWHQVQAGDCWGATPGTPDYNVLVSRPDSACNAPTSTCRTSAPTRRRP